MQLSGELNASKAKAVYSGPLDCAAKTWKHEGLRGIQRGLSAAVSRVPRSHAGECVPKCGALTGTVITSSLVCVPDRT